MDNNYENIVPWNGANDTGKDVRLKLERNFAKIGLNFSEITKKIAVFDTAFSLHYDEGGALESIEALADFWTKKSLSAKGLASGSGSGSSGATTLGGLNNVGSWADEIPTVDRIMIQVAGSTHWASKNLSDIVGLDTTALQTYLDSHSYATQSWVTSQGYATQSALNAVSSKVDTFLEGTDTDGIINKWKELEAFLSGQTQSSTLADLLSVKADKSTVSAMQTAVDKKLDTAYFQRVFGVLDANDNELAGNDMTTVIDSLKLKVGTWTEEYFSIKGQNPGTGTSVSLALSQLADVSLSSPGNGESLVYSAGLGKWVNGAAGLSKVTVKLGNVSYDSVDGTVSLPAYPTSLPASDVYSWAKQSSKPSYSFSELSSHPTTLSGYGITDALYRDDRGSTGWNADNITYSVHGFGYQSDGFPTTGSFISFGGLSNRYVTQIQGRYGNGDSLYFRTRNDDNGTWNSWHNILHSGNYSSYAIPLTGGTVNGNLIINGVTVGQANEIWCTSSDLHIQYAGRSSYGIRLCENNGPLTYGSGGYTLWHSGNGGHGSGLNSDTVDSIHSYNILSRGCYSFTLGTTIATDILASSNTMIQLHITGNSYGAFGGRPIDTYVQVYNYHGEGFTNNPTMLNNGARINYVKVYQYGGYVYFYIPSLSNFISIGVFVSATNTDSLFVNHTTAITNEDNTVNGTNVYTLYPFDSASTADNVASATKLQYSHTIFGQPFDGTANVDGDFTIQNHGIYGYAGRLLFGGNFHIDSLNSFDMYLNYYTDRNIYMCAGSPQGNVVIGTAGTTFKLNVGGDIFSSWLRTAGATGWYSHDYGGGIYMEDATWVRVYGGKSFYVPNELYAVTGIYTDGYLSGKGQNTTSDGRLKRVISRANLSVEAISKAPDIIFAWRDGSGTDVGSIAQYWRKILPASVKELNNHLTFNYGGAAIVGLISVARKVVNHEERIKELENENMQLKQTISNLERRLSA